MMKRVISSAMAAALAAGCATSAKDIKPVPVDQARYADYDCQQIETELAAVYAHAAELRKGIDADAAGDAALVAVGAVLFLPIALFAIGDSDSADAYAIDKGQYEGLQAAGREKNCTIAYKPLQEEPKKIPSGQDRS